ncbi:MAG: ADP-ribosylation factor-like protein [Candidatus Thorarchaeota archaeon]
MIHNTFLIRASTNEILASTQYWPVEVDKAALNEFIATREELRKEDSTLANFPLIIGDDKFQGRDLATDVVLIFVTDKGEDESAIGDRLDSAVSSLRKRLAKKSLPEVLDTFGSIIEPSIITRLKIALVGEGGVGKTTTLHLLMGDTPPLQYVPTIALNLETVENIRFGNYSLVLWDFAGQERFRNLWKFYFHGADVIFLVCDSSLRNVIISKDIYKLIKRDAPKVPVFALANKQDKPNAMRSEVVQKILGIPTYPMVAIDKSRRDEMLRILMTAAAQFVGVVLPDLPASELLRFTDEATAGAIETEQLSSMKEIEEEEQEADVEEVFVDEEGHILTAEEMEGEFDYEIVEEVIEVDEEANEIEADELEVASSEEMLDAPVEMTDEVSEAAIPESEEEPTMPKAMLEQEIATEATKDEAEMPVEPEDTRISDSEPITEFAPPTEEDIADIEVDLTAEEEPTSKLEEPAETSTEHWVEDIEEEVHSDVDEDITVQESPTPEPSLETSPEASKLTEAWELATVSTDDRDESAVSIEMTEDMSEEAIGEHPVESDDSRRMAKDLISEALDADDIIAAEIERVSEDELHIALEAFSSDETVSKDEEENEVSTEQIAQEALKELEDILGPVDEQTSLDEKADTDDVEEDLDALDTLFAMMFGDDDK